MISQGGEAVIPVVPPEEGSSHMYGLYTNAGLDGQTATAEQVVEAARTLWENAQGRGDRAGTAELLAGRRIDAKELYDLPMGFAELVYNGGKFSDLFNLMDDIVKAERAKRESQSK